MNVVDSGGWLEYFGGGSHAEFFAPAICNLDQLLVPTVCLLEVFKRVLQQRNESDALQAVALMQQGTLIELTADIALMAARLGQIHKLPLADSVILASARHHGAVIWTQDAHFEGIDGVHFIAKLT